MSGVFTVSNEDIKKIGIGALIAGAGALATYAIQAIGALDFGLWTPIVVAVCSVAANAIRKWMANKP